MPKMREKILNIFTRNYTLHWYHILGILFISTVLLYLRRPDAFLYPQFWAEDGTEWFRLAYSQGISSLFLPHTGYFQTVSRLIALISLLFPLYFAPAIFNFFALIFKLLPIIFLCSKRFNALVPSTFAKVLLIFLYILLPNAKEVFLNVTNIHWHLSLLACMILMTDQQIKTRTQQIFDYFIFILMGLSGPFILFLLPIVVLRYVIYKEKKCIPLVILTVLLTCIQTISILLTQSTRPQSTLGATPELFLQMGIGQIIIGSIFGMQGYALVFFKDIWNLWYLIPAAVLVCWFMYQIWKQASWPYRFLWIFILLTVTAAIIKPGASYMDPQWPLMVIPGNLARYWFLPTIGIYTMLVFGVYQQKQKIIQYISAGMLVCTFLFGIRTDFFLPPWERLPYYDTVVLFESVPPGTIIEFPIMPKGWTMPLLKK